MSDTTPTTLLSLINKHISRCGDYKIRTTRLIVSHADSNRDVHKRHPEVIQKANKMYSAKYSVTVKAIEVNTGECLVFESRRAASRALNIAVSDIWMILSTDEKYSSHKSAISPDGKRWTFE